MLIVMILIAVFVQFVVFPALFYASARLFRTKAGPKRAMLTWLALFAINMLLLLVSIAVKANILVLSLSIGAIVLSVGLTARLLRVGIWRGAGVFVTYIVAGVAIVLSIRAVAVEAFLVPLASMAPTILPGDRILVDKLTPRFMPPKQGDVVAYEVYEEPYRPGSHVAERNKPVRVTYVKRIAGLPGDLVEIRDEQVYVNGESVGSNLAARHGRPSAEPFQGPIPEGMMYVIGDNKEWSKDSRIFGPVPISSIKGKAVIIYASTVVDLPLLRQRTLAADPPDWYDPDDPPGRVRWERVGKVIR